MARTDVAQVAAVLGAISAPLLLVARSRAVLLGGFLLLGAAELGIALALVPDQLELLIRSPLRLLALAGFVVVAVALAALFIRLPAAVPVALLVAAPFRVPVELGGAEGDLLLPLYAVLAASVLALAYRTLRGASVGAVPLVLAVPASAFIGLSAISLTWTRDLRAGMVELFFFFFPFIALAAVVARTPWAHWLPRALAVSLLALASVFAAIGIWQAWSHDLFFAPDVQFANAYTEYFRVTSLFRDPSIYGRQLVVGLAVLVAALWLGRIRLELGAALVALLGAGLFFAYSQSSLIALFVAVLGVSFVAADARTRRLLAAVAVVAVLAAGGLIAEAALDDSARRATGGRSRLVGVTAPVFYDNPVIGVGIGSQPLASREEEGARERKGRNVSHTAPLTVAAELGTVGLLAYVLLLLGAARLFVLALRTHRALGLSVGAVFLAVFVHSLGYSGFFSEPLVWGSLALAAASLSWAASPAPARAWKEHRGAAPQAKPIPAQPPNSPAP